MSSTSPTSVTFREPVTTADGLRSLLGAPGQAALRKQIATLDDHCRHFIARSPILFLSTANDAGQCDVSPKGDVPGFVRILSDTQLAIPDRPGNRRADSLLNILANPEVGLLFVIPGMRETLRINGAAALYTDAELLDSLAVEGKRPQVAIVVEAREVYLHCGRALVRSALWDSATWPRPETLPSAAQIFADHIALPDLTCEVAERVLEEDYRELY